MFVWSSATPYALALMGAALICLALAGMGLQRRTRPGGVEFSAMMVSAAIWALLYSFELLAPSLGGKVTWAKLEYVGIVGLPVTWFLFTRSYTGASKGAGPKLLALLSVVPVATVVMAATNGSHGLLWTKMSLYTGGSFPSLLVVHGPWFWVHMLYSYGLLALGSFQLMRTVYHYPQIYRRQAGTLMIATGAPWVANALLISGLLPTGSVDPTPFAFTITGVALALSMSRLRLFKLLPALLPTARSQVLNQMEDGIVVVDSEGVVVAVNPAVCRMFTKSANEFMGESAADALGGAVAARLAVDPECGSRFEITTGDEASPRSYDVITSALGPKTGADLGRLLVFRDITDFKQSTDALKTSEERFRAIIEQLSEGFFLIDEHGMITEWNAAMEQISGRRSDSVLGRPAWDILVETAAPERRVPGFLERMKTILLDAMGSAQSPFFASKIEAVIVRPDGQRRDIQETAFPVRAEGSDGIGMVIRDVTEAKQAQEALKLTQLSVDNAADLIYWIGPDGRLLYVSDSMCRRHGYSRDELLGLTIFDLDATMTMDAWRAHWLEVERAGSLTMETVHRTKEGEFFPVEVTTNFVEHNGQKYNFVYARDITSRKEVEEQLRQSQKMEAIGQLAGGIAHDFNNLLTAIIGYSDLILAREDLAGDTLRGDVGEIKGAAERAAGLTRQILAFSRRQVLKPRVVSLNGVLVDMEPLLRRTLGEDVDLDLRLEPDLSDVEVDPHQMEQVLMNLAVNARDAMADGGFLTVETAEVELGAEYARIHPGVKPGRHVMLAVSDSGCGMGPEIKSRLFEPFFTTKEAGKGTGLGLSTVFGIVKQSGGSISVYSEPGHGSTFKVYLPRAHRRLGAEDGPLQSLETPRHGSEAILVVEDEASLRQLVVRVLTQSGYEVLEAGSGPEVYEALDKGRRFPELLLTDLVLPGGASGRDVADMLLEQHPDLRVLYMSGYAKNSVVHEGRLDKGVEFLGKPFTPGELSRRVREVLDADQALAS